MITSFYYIKNINLETSQHGRKRQCPRCGFIKAARRSRIRPSEAIVWWRVFLRLSCSDLCLGWSRHQCGLSRHTSETSLGVPQVHEDVGRLWHLCRLLLCLALLHASHLRILQIGLISLNLQFIAFLSSAALILH